MCDEILGCLDFQCWTTIDYTYLYRFVDFRLSRFSVLDNRRAQQGDTRVDFRLSRFSVLDNVVGLGSLIMVDFRLSRFSVLDNSLAVGTQSNGDFRLSRFSVLDNVMVGVWLRMKILGCLDFQCWTTPSVLINSCQ